MPKDWRRRRFEDILQQLVKDAQQLKNLLVEIEGLRQEVATVEASIGRRKPEPRRKSK